MQNNISWYTFPKVKHVLPLLTYISDRCCFSYQFLPLDLLAHRQRGHIGHGHETLQFRIDTILKKQFHKKGNFTKKVISQLQLNNNCLRLCSIFTSKSYICIANYNVFHLIRKKRMLLWLLGIFLQIHVLFIS